MNPPITYKLGHGCITTTPSLGGDPGSPLDDFIPELVEASLGGQALRWAADGAGCSMAVAFAALGFTVLEHLSYYLVPLDMEADRRLLRLYDLIANLRWRQPYRQLRLLDASEANWEPREVGDV